MYTTVDHIVIGRLSSDSLDYLGPGFDKDKVLLFLTDAAPYMVAAANVLCHLRQTGTRHVCGKWSSPCM